MATQTSSAVEMEYTFVESIKGFFYLSDDISSFEQFIEHTQGVQNTLRDLKDKGWVFSGNSGDWFEMTAPSREAAVAYAGEEYVKQLEEDHQEALYDDEIPAD